MVFLSTQANRYTVMAASQEFLDTGAYNLSASNKTSTRNSDISGVLQTAQDFRERINHSRTFENLSNSECLNAYAKQYVSSRGDVLLVQDGTMEKIIDTTLVQLNSGAFIDWPYHRVIAAAPPIPYYSDPLSYGYTDEPSYNWQCSYGYNKTCDPEEKRSSDVRDWNPFGNTVKYCLSERAQEECKLLFSLDFACVVLVCNLLKILCMVLALVRYNKSSTLITIGDAISSFLDDPDPATEGLCIYSMMEIECLWRGGPDPCSRSPFARLIPRQRKTQQSVAHRISSKKWWSKTVFWGNAASVTRWVCCYFA